jgi:hypothetical protein
MKPFFLLIQIGAVLPVSLEKGLPSSATRTLIPIPTSYWLAEPGELS